MTARAVVAFGDSITDGNGSTLDADTLLPAFDSGDHLHPGDRGYEAMADAIDTNLLFGAQ